MGCGIREPRINGFNPLGAPGTVILYRAQQDNPTRNIREKVTIIPAPRPSRSPRDPLRWPLWKKDLALFAMCLPITVGGIQDSLLSTVNAVLATEFERPIEEIEKLSSYPLLTSGATCAIASILAHHVGKRPIYIVSTIILCMTCLWSALIGGKTQFRNFFAARILSGVGLGTFEALVLSSIGDLYFVHQRGKRVAFLNIMSLGPINLSPILAGHVADKHGWRTNFWILFAFTATNLILIIFFCPETQFNRPPVYNTDITIVEVEPQVNDETGSRSNGTAGAAQVREAELNEKPLSYWKELRPWSRLYTRSNPVRHVSCLFACVRYPAVIWTVLTAGTYSGWFSGLSITIAQIFSAYTPTEIGRLNTFPALAAFVAFAVLNVLADTSVKWAARRNHGIYEPEFRLYLISFGLLVGVPGLALFGWYAETTSPSWTIISFLYGLIIFSTVTQQSTSFAYLLDAHRDISIETAVFVVMVRNFFSFGAGSFLPLWLHHGTTSTFCTIAAIQAGLVLTTVPLYVFGKVIRRALRRG
ncbi:MAG: hypothetical protein L6R41_004951 [Letrouitia leprolyta]|nr:MAG: hypothetical protein L6R41_004951 [Letrouitia leprolyta]